MFNILKMQQEICNAMSMCFGWEDTVLGKNDPRCAGAFQEVVSKKAGRALQRKNS